MRRAGKRKEREFFAKFTTKFHRQKPAKKEVKDQKAAAKFSRRNSVRKFLRAELLWMGQDLNSRQIFRAKFTQKSALNLQNLS